MISIKHNIDCRCILFRWILLILCLLYCVVLSACQLMFQVPPPLNPQPTEGVCVYTICCVCRYSQYMNILWTDLIYSHVHSQLEFTHVLSGYISRQQSLQSSSSSYSNPLSPLSPQQSSTTSSLGPCPTQHLHSFESLSLEGI